MTKAGGMRFGHGTNRQRAEGNSVLRRAREVGLAGDVETLQMLVQAWRAGYSTLVKTTPEGSQVRALVEGAMGKIEILSRDYMEST